MTNIYNQLNLNDYLGGFVFTPNLLPFTNDEILSLDKELYHYEQLFLSPDVERYLIGKNEMLTSFAISKAEDSKLSLKEAQEMYDLVLNKREYHFLGRKIKAKFALVKKDYEKLEFFNIAKTFRDLNRSRFALSDLTPEFIKELHQKVSLGMDIFKKYLSDFTVYKSGRWRDSNDIRVGDYIPPPFEKVEGGVLELISWLKDNLSPVSVAAFHTALYALHPFNNGNKRVCRLLEHLLLRTAGLNQKNLYNTSYYYHRQKQRYYKQLLYSLDRKNLNHFASFVLESIVLSIISVVKTSLEVKRSEFLAKKDIDGNAKRILKPLVKRRELQFKNLFRTARGKMARQTFVSALQKATEALVVLKRESGRSTYYRLNMTAHEEETINKWISFAGGKLDFIPDDIRLA